MGGLVVAVDCRLVDGHSVVGGWWFVKRKSVGEEGVMEGGPTCVGGQAGRRLGAGRLAGWLAGWS